MTVFVLSSSLRKESWNTKLAKAAAAELRSRGADARAATLADYAMPLYDQDIQDRDGIPKGARDLADRFRDADAFVVVSPEYNHSISGVLKNAVDWISRLRPVPWLDKPALLMSATPGAGGGRAGLYQTRIPFEATGAMVLPRMFSLPHAERAFGGDGSLADEKVAERLGAALDDFLHVTNALNTKGDSA